MYRRVIAPLVVELDAVIVHEKLSKWARLGEGLPVPVDETFDYIVVGAGSAGAVVASALSADPGVSVLLLEAGPEDSSHWTKVPLGFGKVLFDPKYMWFHETQPEPGLGARRVSLPHGKVLGGSSAINGLQYARGVPFDYDNWERLGATNWSYKDVLPYFKRMERYHLGADEFHGEDGPIGVETVRWKTPLGDAFIAAGEAMGLPRNDDPNGQSGEGVGYVNVNAWRGRRSSTSEAYLKRARKRPNLRIVTEALATRILLKGREATGIRYERGGKTYEAHARAEVVLSLGALQTPQLLQVSGIGPAALLREHGVEPVHDLPGVGENLIDHVHAGVTCRSSSSHTINAIMSNPLSQLRHGLDYYLGRRRGVLTLGASQTGGFVRSRDGLPAPDLQFGLTPFLPDEVDMWKLAKGSGFGIGVYFTRPQSRGYVRMGSSDMREPPRIQCNYFTHEEDQAACVRGLNFVRKLMHTDPLSAFVEVELRPGPNVRSDDELLDYARQACGTAFHFCGTARMGTDIDAVVDPELRVHGIGRLRVADASVMPAIITGNTNAASMMIGERAAEFIGYRFRNNSVKGWKNA